MKSGFSLLELIFAIVIIALISSFAIPKFLDTKDSATVSTLKRDVATTITSIQTYYLSNGSKIDKISDAITLNSKNWVIEDLKVTDKDSCLTIEVKDEAGVKIIDLVVDEQKDGICVKIRDAGITSAKYNLM